MYIYFIKNFYKNILKCNFLKKNVFSMSKAFCSHFLKFAVIQASVYLGINAIRKETKIIEVKI